MAPILRVSAVVQLARKFLISRLNEPVNLLQAIAMSGGNGTRLGSATAGESERAPG